MIRRYSAPLSAAVFGVLCAGLEWYNRTRGFGGDGLPVRGHPSFPLLCAAIAIGLAVCALSARTYPIHEKWQFEDYFSGDSTILKLLSVVGGLLLLLGGVGGIAVGALTLSSSGALINLVGPSILPGFILGLLALAAGAVCIPLARAQAAGKVDEGNASSTLLLMAWAAFYLILVFKDNNTNPYFARYLADLLTGVSLTLAFLFYSRFLYSKPMPRRFLFFAGAGVILSFALAGGAALAVLLPGDGAGVPLADLMRFISALGAGTYLLGQMIRMCAPRRQSYYWQE